MKYLFISSATADLVVAIMINEKIVYEYNKTCFKDMSKYMMPALDSAFKHCNITPKDLDKIFVVTGPGSFTGIRIGLTTAKTMAWALNIPLVPISTLEMLSSGNSKNVIALMDARRGYVYAGGYDKELNPFMKDKYTLLKNIKGNNFVSNDEFNFAVEKPKIDILKLLKKHENEEFNPHKVNPKYLKKTEAEEKCLKK